jgi:hypothetical protein
MQHLMIDLETLGRTPQAPIIAIGAVYFDPNTGALGESYYSAIDFESACERRTPYAATVKWWLSQSDDARKAVVKGKEDMKEALRGLIQFIKANDGATVWGNGSTFDISMLEDCIRQYKGRVPWQFWAVRDVRTVVEMGELKGVKRDSVKFIGTPHHALDDAKHQARYVSKMWQALVGGTN